jgi:hypothetical protein
MEIVYHGLQYFDRGGTLLINRPLVKFAFLGKVDVFSEGF